MVEAEEAMTTTPLRRAFRERIWIATNAHEPGARFFTDSPKEAEDTRRRIGWEIHEYRLVPEHGASGDAEDGPIP